MRARLQRLFCELGLHLWTEREDAEYGGRVYRCDRPGCYAQKHARLP